MIRKIHLFTLLILLQSGFLFSQSGRISSNRIKNVNYTEKTVIFKIKPEFRKLIASQKIDHPAFTKLFADIKIISIEKAFPQIAAPEQKFSKSGKKMVDLSTVFIVRYVENKKVEDVINQLIKTGVIEYAEPQYKDEPLYVPNDPQAQSAAPAPSQYFYLQRMQAYQAWDITKGDTNMVIGIIDTGIDPNHDDLKGNIKYNYADPVNGVDDDGDGYKDNFRGFDLGSNDNDPTANINGHGAQTSGCASAATDNGIGVAGTGFKCKFLPIKASGATSSLDKGYQGVVYAADHGAKVINLSWGSANSYSAFNQDAINYAVINKDVVVIAASGNSSLEEDFYPASYENVLSVAACDTLFSPTAGKQIDIKAGFSTYGNKVDICAQGTKVYTTNTSNAYLTNAGGTSFSSPLVAGAAALVRVKYPGYNALQVAELLRVTADPMDIYTENLQHKEKIGRGRVNMYRALTETSSPAVRANTRDIKSKINKEPFAGDTANVICNFTDYLAATQNLTVTLSCNSPYVTVVDSVSVIGALTTLGQKNNSLDPFKIHLKNNIPLNQSLRIRLGFSDPGTSYTDYQYFDFVVNPRYLTIDTNQVAVTVTRIGRIGYEDLFSTIGQGFIYNTKPLLSEAGLMVALNNTKVSDCVRGAQFKIDSDFVARTNLRYINPSTKDVETQSVFTDSLLSSKIGIAVEQRSYAYTSAPDDKYVILEYNIQNLSGATIDTLRAGIFADWDIQVAANFSDWDPVNNLGYIYNPAVGGLYAGTALLSNQTPSFFSLDHTGSAGGNNINPNDAFTTQEKYTTLASKIGRAHGGGASGADVSNVVGAEIYNIQNNEVRKIVFAILAGDNLTDIQASTAAAKARYNGIVTTVRDIEEESNGITIYPNPTKGIITVHFTEKPNTDPVYSVVNLLGETVKSGTLKENSENIDLSLLSEGIYFIRVKTDANFTVKKILVE